MISVVIPLYNKAEAIARTVESVLAQTDPDWELVVVDDGSRDDGPQIVSRYTDPRIRLERQANAGVSAARNRGAELARHELVAFLDADDYWDPGHIANLRQLIQRFPDAALYATAYNVVNESGQSRKIRVRHDGDGQDYILMADYFADIMEVEHPVHSSAVAVRKPVFKRVGGFPVGVKAGEDIICWSRLACAGPLAYAKQATAFYVLPPVSVGKRSSALRRPQKPDRVAAELEKLHDTTPRLARSLKRFLGEWHRIRAMLFLELNERADCLYELRQATACSPMKLRDAVSFVMLALPHLPRQRLLARLRAAKGRA